MYDFTQLFPCVLQVSAAAPSFCNYRNSVTDYEARSSLFLLLGLNPSFLCPRLFSFPCSQTI